MTKRKKIYLRLATSDAWRGLLGSADKSTGSVGGGLRESNKIIYIYIF